MEVEELANVALRNGDLIVVKLDLNGNPGMVETTVSGINTALGAAVQSTGARDVGVAILDKNTTLETLDAEQLAVFGLQRIPSVEEVEEAS